MSASHAAVGSSAAFLAFVISSTPALAADRAGQCADQAERGQEIRDKLELVEARELFLACAQQDCPAVVRDSCTGWLADVDKRLPSIVVSAKDREGHDLKGVQVSIDDVRNAETNEARALRVNPGTHTIRYELDGFQSAQEEIVLREGEGVRVLNVTLKRPTESPEQPRRGISPLVYVLGGTSLVAFGVFGIAAATGASDYRELEERCAPKCPQSEMQAVETRFVVADVSLLVGAVTLAGAAGLFLWNKLSK